MGSGAVFPRPLLEALQDAARLVVFTGAGVSAESGIQTFRGGCSRRARYDPMVLATPEAFLAAPDLVWGWYEWRRGQILQACPNPAHLAIACMGRQFSQVTLVTQNVDDLHERAGSPEVLHLHGSLHQPRCSRCNQPFMALPPPVAGSVPEERQTPPLCPHCGGLVRPGVVWFGETLPGRVLDAALTAASTCDVLLSVGTSGAVYPAAHIPEQALEAGATVIHVNPVARPVRSGNEFSLEGPAGELLPALLEQLAMH